MLVQLLCQSMCFNGKHVMSITVVEGMFVGFYSVSWAV